MTSSGANLLDRLSESILSAFHEKRDLKRFVHTVYGKDFHTSIDWDGSAQDAAYSFVSKLEQNDLEMQARLFLEHALDQKWNIYLNPSIRSLAEQLNVEKANSAKAGHSAAAPVERDEELERKAGQTTASEAYIPETHWLGFLGQTSVWQQISNELGVSTLESKRFDLATPGPHASQSCAVMYRFHRSDEWSELTRAISHYLTSRGEMPDNNAGWTDLKSMVVPDATDVSVLLKEQLPEFTNDEKRIKAMLSLESDDLKQAFRSLVIEHYTDHPDKARLAYAILDERDPKKQNNKLALVLKFIDWWNDQDWKMLEGRLLLIIFLKNADTIPWYRRLMRPFASKSLDHAAEIPLLEPIALSDFNDWKNKFLIARLNAPNRSEWADWWNRVLVCDWKKDILSVLSGRKKGDAVRFGDIQRALFNKPG